MSHWGRSTHESAPALKRTSPYSCFEGNAMDKSKASPPVACQEWGCKHPLHRWENFHHRGASITTTTRFMFKRPLGCVLRLQGCHHPSYIMIWWEVSHQGWHINFCKKGVKLVSKCIKRTCSKELWNVLTWPSWVVWNGSSSRTQFLPKRPNSSGVAAEEPSGLHQHQELAFGECRPQTPNKRLWAVLEDMAWWKRHNSLESLRRSLVTAAAEIPLEMEHVATA